MDYSLLFAVERVKKDAAVNQKHFAYRANEGLAINSERHRKVSSCGRFIYHLALIDYLQTFNFDKWSESKAKTWILRRNLSLMSAVEPGFYAERFKRFMSSEVFIESNLFEPDQEYAKLQRYLLDGKVHSESKGI